MFLKCILCITPAWFHHLSRIFFHETVGSIDISQVLFSAPLMYNEVSLQPMTGMSHLLDFCSEEMEKIKIPKDMDDAKALGTVLSKYKDTYYTQVLVAYFATYVLYPFEASREEHLLFVLVHVYLFLYGSDYYSCLR